jgi:hypothetical protein
VVLSEAAAIEVNKMSLDDKDSITAFLRGKVSVKDLAAYPTPVTGAEKWRSRTTNRWRNSLRKRSRSGKRPMET